MKTENLYEKTIILPIGEKTVFLIVSNGTSVRNRSYYFKVYNIHLRKDWGLLMLIFNQALSQVRKENKIKTIHSSLKIEGNTLTEEQITALLENKRIMGPKKDVKEVLNAIAIYDF